MKNTTTSIMQMKHSGNKISMLTAYDYTTARLLDEAGVNTILVGDSLGNVVLGYEDTISVTMEDMIHHSAAVARGTKNALVVTDMPFMSYQTGVYDAVVNAGRLMKEGRAGAVKLEGGAEICPQIEAIVAAVILLLLSLIEKVPSIWNFPVAVTEENKERLYKIALVMLGAIKILTTGLFIDVGVSSLVTRFPVWPMYIMLGAMVIVIVVAVVQLSLIHI